MIAVTFILAGELLREALRRKWVLALGIAITGFLVLTMGALRLDVVDRALSAGSQFGNGPNGTLRPVDFALRPVFKAAAYFIFYIGTAFSTVACAEFAPKIMTPGRIEHLLSQPVKRVQVIVATFLGVWLLATGAMLYASLGFSVILSVKTGVSIVGPVIAAVVSSLVWAAIYSAMLAASVIARSTVLSAVTGFFVLIGGVIAGHRAGLLELFAPGPIRVTLRFLTLLFPNVSALAEVTGKIAASERLSFGSVVPVVLGFVAFSLVGLTVASLCFEKRDF